MKPIYFLHTDPQKAASFLGDASIKYHLSTCTIILSNTYYHWVENIYPQYYQEPERDMMVSYQWQKVMENYPRKQFVNYKHWNNPISQWAMYSLDNWEWLMFFTYYISSEWVKRNRKNIPIFDKRYHRDIKVIQWMVLNPPEIPRRGLTPLPKINSKKFKPNRKGKNLIKRNREAYVKNEKSIIKKYGWYGKSKRPRWVNTLLKNC